MDGGAYGAGKAGQAFDPLAFIKKPQVILRAVSLIFSIIVFGCISSGGWLEGECLYGGDKNACSFGSAVGIIAFMACIGFLILDALFDNFSSVQQRKYAVIGDLGFSGFWTFIWFVNFCYLTNKWSTRDVSKVDKYAGRDNPQAAIAFSFFSIGTWAALTFFAVMRYRQGSAAAFAPSYEPDSGVPQSAPYTSYPDSNDPYQQPPFTTPQGGPQPGGQPAPEYQPPTY